MATKLTTKARAFVRRCLARAKKANVSLAKASQICGALVPKRKAAKKRKTARKRRKSNPGFLPGGNEMKGFLVLENAESAAREISARLGRPVHVNVQKSTGRYVLSPKKNSTTVESYGVSLRRRSR